MKDLYKRIIPIFGASCCLLSNKEQKFPKFLENYEKIFLQGNLDNNFNSNKSSTWSKNENLKTFVEQLNKTEIYLLVTAIKQEKIEKPILLLLQTEDRLNAEQSLIDYRHLKFLFSSSNDRKNAKFSIYDIVRSNKFPNLAKTFRSGKSYYVNNLGGYKAICPVFFDKDSAEDFLIQSSKDVLALLKTLPLDSNKEILKSVLNTKIISVGLGDFIEYYSMDKNQSHLEKIEFLFVPCLQKEKSNSKELTKQINNLVNTENFKTYQQKYSQLKRKEY